MKLNSRSIFLVDSMGAFASGLALAVLLPWLQTWVGMPRNVLYALGVGAFTYSLYSLVCFVKFGNQPIPWLNILIAANLGYCLLTASLVLLYFSQLTWLGIGYFTIEIVIILGLVFVEFLTLRTCSTTHSV